MGSKRGFTLAEVLVTLAIIGVVAALTVPALVQTSNSKKYTSGLKKSVSVLNQALLMSIANTGNDASASGVTSNDTLANIFANYMSVVKRGATNNIVYTADGMKYTFVRTGACQDDVTNDLGTSANCLVTVDVNGDTGPNTNSTSGAAVATSTDNVYSDIFYLVIENDTVVPANAATANSFNSGVDDVALDALIND